VRVGNFFQRKFGANPNVELSPLDPGEEIAGARQKLFA
jgi:hypothetical protein